MTVQIIKNNNIIDVMEVGVINHDRNNRIILHPMQDVEEMQILINNQHLLSTFEFIIDPEDTPSFKIIN